MIAWIIQLIVWLLPEILCLVLLPFIAFSKRKSNGVKVFMCVLIVFLYWCVRKGDEVYALQRMNMLCMKNDVIEIQKTVEISSSHWREDGSPKFYDDYDGFVFQATFDGVNYEAFTIYGEVDIFGITEDISSFVNTDTGEVYGIAKSYRYFGTWYGRKTSRSLSLHERCFWSEVAEEKYDRTVKHKENNLESWVLVPAEL